MAFEDLPVQVGDKVTAVGFSQTEGEVIEINITEEPDVLCFVQVRFNDPVIHNEFVFCEGDDYSKAFSKKE